MAELRESYIVMFVEERYGSIPEGIERHEVSASPVGWAKEVSMKGLRVVGIDSRDSFLEG